jgi:hypothetical protein
VFSHGQTAAPARQARTLPVIVVERNGARKRPQGGFKKRSGCAGLNLLAGLGGRDLAHVQKTDRALRDCEISENDQAAPA